MGAAGRKRVEERYSLQVYGPRVASRLSELAGRSAEPRTDMMEQKIVMCGIAGLLINGENRCIRFLKLSCRRCLDRLTHRGPDGAGLLVSMMEIGLAP